MTGAERDYLFIARTFDAPGLAPEAFAERIAGVAMPAWRALHAEGVLHSVETLHKVGDIEMQTSSEGVRDWGYFVALELAAGASADAVLAAERAAGLEAALASVPGVDYLSGEVLVRPAGAGTAIPRPLSAAPPAAKQRAGIEYIHIPDRHWDDYRRFMHDVMGPVGVELVASGRSHRIQILERTRLLRWDPSLPPWNRIHILWGEFDDPEGGFLRHTTEVIRAHVGLQHDVSSMLGSVDHYRTKPRMSKNLRLEALCLPPAQGPVTLPRRIT